MGLGPSVEDKVIPCGKFKSLAALNRYKNLCLWLPVTVASKKLPWGYEADPSNPKVALPDEKALAIFVKAKKHLKTNSYQVVAEWITSCGYPIGDWGLAKLLKERPFWPEIELSFEERMKL